MTWTFLSGKPIYAQIIEQITHSVISGGLPAGAKLPSVRDMAREAGVNPNTMQRALSELEREGLVYSQRTSGRFITESEDLISALKEKTAREKTGSFLREMLLLGYTAGQAADLILNYGKAEKNE